MGSQEDARRSRRFATRIAATLRVDRRTFDVKIVDISSHGACVHGRRMPGRGTEVVLVARGLDAVATIVWADERACGFNFHCPIDPHIVVGDDADLPNIETKSSALAMRG